ncbi:MAG: hypothetical protein JWQ19_3926 [Subtercola sp.]|nr:hypothetical protein [Subtercola sp.]
MNRTRKPFRCKIGMHSKTLVTEFERRCTHCGAAWTTDPAPLVRTGYTEWDRVTYPKPSIESHTPAKPAHQAVDRQESLIDNPPLST